MLLEPRPLVASSRPSGDGTAPGASMQPGYSGFWVIAACVGATPAGTQRNGGRGSSSKLVRLIVLSTVLVLGSMTTSVLESSLVMKTRSRGSMPGPGAVVLVLVLAAGAWACAAGSALAAAAASENLRMSRRWVVMGAFVVGMG